MYTQNTNGAELMVFKANGIQIERNHTLWTSVVYNLNFSK